MSENGYVLLVSPERLHFSKRFLIVFLAGEHDSYLESVGLSGVIMVRKTILLIRDSMPNQSNERFEEADDSLRQEYRLSTLLSLSV